MATTYEIRQAMLNTIERYGIKEVAAYNARFDDNALRVTQRYVTYSKWRYWFPFDSVEIWDIMKMTQDVICNMPTYKKFCQENGYVQANGVPARLRKSCGGLSLAIPILKKVIRGLRMF